MQGRPLWKDLCEAQEVWRKCRVPTPIARSQSHIHFLNSYINIDKLHSRLCLGLPFWCIENLGDSHKLRGAKSAYQGRKVCLGIDYDFTHLCCNSWIHLCVSFS